MDYQVVFKAGNSNVVSIPKKISKELGLKPGVRVVVEKDNNNSVVVKKAENSQKTTKKASSKEFDKWLKNVLKEDEKLLDELSVR